MIVSRAKKVLWAFHSGSMRAKRMSYIDSGSPVPAPTPTGKLWNSLGTVDLANAEGHVDAGVWYDRPFCGRLWEEAMPLGNTGLVLTFLVLPDSNN